MIAQTSVVVRYIVTAGVLSYAVPFPIYSEKDVRVTFSTDGRTETALVPGAEYTVTVLSSGGGTVTLGSAGIVPIEAVLAVASAIPATQEADFSATTDVDTGALETQLDRQVQMIRQLEAELDRAVKVPAASEESPESVARDIYTARDAAEASAGAAGDSAARAARSAANAANSAGQSAGAAADAEYWAGRAEDAGNNGPATPGHIGGVKPRHGLSVMEDGTLDLNTGDGLEIDATENAPRVNASGIRHGVLAVAHGGTGADTAQGARDNLGLSAWQKGMEGTNPQRLRNVILSGREKDGYPAYLVGQEFIDMQHEDGVYISKRGTVSAGGEYSASHRATRPLRNQLVYQAQGWLTPNTVTSGQWEYAFADRAHVLTGLYLQNRDNEPQCFPRKWQLQGWNESSGLWEDIYRRDNDQALRGSSDNLKDNGRMYWFTENATAYRRVRINIESNHGGAYSQLAVIRLYEAVIPGLHKYDPALYATPETPFAASVACGLSADGTARTLDRPVKVTEHVVFDGRKLAEMSRNYIYVVPADESTGRLPDNPDADRAVPLPGNAAFLYADTRKLHYGTRGDIEKECFALLQSRHTVAYDPVPNGMFEMNQGAWNHPLYFQNVRVDPTEKPRGAASSYRFTGVDNWIGPNADLTAALLGKNAHPYSNECTVELDFKWNGPAPETTDDYFILFDNGYYTSRGWALAYHNRKKCLALHWGSKSISNWCYHAPFNAADGTWHTVSVSQRDSNLFIHVDGVCLGAFNYVPLCNPNYRYWFLGRWIHSGSHQWYGHLNNLRVTLGTALYQGRDYAVSPAFNRGPIPDKTLWYDAAEGVVKEWQAEAGVWLKTPMLPVGHVDTGRREHLMTDQPRGTWLNQPTKYVLPEGYASDGSYTGNTTAASLLNFGDGGANVYASPNNATTEHFIQFTLERPMAFERLMLTPGVGTFLWNAFPCKFRLSGGNDDGQPWVMLIDRTAFADDGGMMFEGASPNGSSPNLRAYKSFSYDNSTAFSMYRLDFPAKNDVPLYKDYGYTATAALFTFRDARPELLGISSYATGGAWTIGPVPLGVNTEAEIPVPFGNLPFSVDGSVEEEHDYQVRKRRLGEMSGWYNSGYYVTGEIVYRKSDAVVLVTGNHAVSQYNGAYWNSPSVNTQSNKANYYLSLQRRGV